MRLCKACAEKERKESGWRQDGPGLRSMSMPRMSSCPTCKTQSHGFSLCAGCVVNEGHCQGCFTPIKASVVLLSEIADHHQTLTEARAVAHALYTQTIEPFKDQAAKFELAIAASETQRNSDCEPFWDAATLADKNYHETSHNAPDSERIARSTAYLDARRASDENAPKAFERERERNGVLRREFAQYWIYDNAVRLYKRTLERASATYTAAVDRSTDIADAETVRQAAVEKAESRYQRALDFQDSLDRLLSAV